MRCFAFSLSACLLTGLATSGCSEDSSASAPPLLDASAVETDVDSDAEPDATIDVISESLSDGDSADTAEADAGDCDGFEAEPLCLQGECFSPAGCFMMGSPADEPGHTPLEAPARVSFDLGMMTWQHEVTRADWTALGFPIPAGFTEDIAACTDDDCPVTGITWFEALAFANAYSVTKSSEPCYVLDGCTGAMGEGMVCETVTPVHDGKGYCGGCRVPTSAEWEYAARGGTTSAYYNGPNQAVPDAAACAADPGLDGIGWYCDNAGTPSSTHPIGMKTENPFGLDDMAGNAAEWVSDGFPSQPLEPEPFAGMIAGVSADGPGQVRGGHAGSSPWDCRSASRRSVPKDARFSSVGFRLVQTFLAVQ